MQVELTEQERQMLIAALNNMPVKGIEAMQVILLLAEKLSRIAPDSKQSGG